MLFTLHCRLLTVSCSLTHSITLSSLSHVSVPPLFLVNYSPLHVKVAKLLTPSLGWEDKVTVPLTTKTVFPSGTAHEVIAPNKVIELRENSVVLEKPFEGSTEVTFFVSCSQ